MSSPTCWPMSFTRLVGRCRSPRLVGRVVRRFVGRVVRRLVGRVFVRRLVGRVVRRLVGRVVRATCWPSRSPTCCAESFARLVGRVVPPHLLAESFADLLAESFAEARPAEPCSRPGSPPVSRVALVPRFADRRRLTRRLVSPSLTSPAVGCSARYRSAGTIVPVASLPSGGNHGLSTPRIQLPLPRCRRRSRSCACRRNRFSADSCSHP